MTSVDDLFRKPNGPSSFAPAKRKLQVPDGDAAYKAAKLSATGDVKSNGRPTVEDEEEEEEDVEAGPELPPEEEEDTDEEGRFFGSGVNRDTKDAMDYLETAGDNGFVDEKIDAAWARRLVTNFERKINKNSEQRARFENEPEKFMQSEADLDAEVKRISVLTDHTGFYSEFAKAGGCEQLVSLLAHDNTDIAINAIEIISELIDEDVEVGQYQWDALVDAMLDADLVNLLAQNFERFDEAGNQSDTQGVYHSLAVLEALASQGRVAEKAGSDTVLRYLLQRIQREEPNMTQNKQYAAEVLQVFLQDSSTLRRRVVKLGGMDAILQLLSAYRRKDPEDSSLEEEYAMNLFNALVCLVQEDAGKTAFLEGEGVELMLIMVREGKMSKPEALKTLDHASGGRGQAVCEKTVEAGGLKTLFGLFKKKLDQGGIENLVDILAALLRFLPGESAERIRTLAKFAEKSYEKVDKLMEWRQKFALEVAKVDDTISRERKALSKEDQEATADEWYLRRLDAGSYVLQTINVVLSWLAAEDPAARKVIVAALKQQGQTVADLRSSLKEQLDGVDLAADEDFAEMLKALVDAIS